MKWILMYAIYTTHFASSPVTTNSEQFKTQQACKEASIELNMLKKDKFVIIKSVCVKSA